jgi:hypothetical protein
MSHYPERIVCLTEETTVDVGGAESQVSQDLLDDLGLLDKM